MHLSRKAKTERLKRRALILGEVHEELDRATRKFPPMNSAHEGYAILWEEVGELWQEVMKNPLKRNKAKMRNEAIQVAAMAIRFIEDVCDVPKSITK